VPARGSSRNQRQRRPDLDDLAPTVRAAIAEEYRLAATRYAERFDEKRGGSRAWVYRKRQLNHSPSE